MGNAEWLGARLADVLKAAGVKSGAVDVTFNGLDQPAAPGVPDLVKSLGIERIMNDPNVLVAYEMNGKPLPMLNGFPARIVVPGWYSAYWVKNLSEISVLDHAFDGFWMKTAYRIPDTACGCVEPGAKPARTVPINRMKVRSVIAVPSNGTHVHVGRAVTLKGVAFDGGYGIGEVLVSEDGARSWKSAVLGDDLGPYSFRVWSYNWAAKKPGNFRLMVRAISKEGESQPLQTLWNPSGYLYNAVQRVDLVGASPRVESGGSSAVKQAWAAVLVFGVATTGGFGGGALAAQTPTPSSSSAKTIDLPPDNAMATLKPGPGVEAVCSNCVISHSTDYIVRQPGGDAKHWEPEVKKMIAVYGASFTDADVQTIVTYLATEYGTPPATTAPGAAKPPQRTRP